MDPEDFMEASFVHELIESGELDGLGLVDPDERAEYYGDAKTAREHGPEDNAGNGSCFGMLALAAVLGGLFAVMLSAV